MKLTLSYWLAAASIQFDGSGGALPIHLQAYEFVCPYLMQLDWQPL